MKTRGKTKVENPSIDYLRDTGDSRDLMDDGENTNGYTDEKVEDVIPHLFLYFILTKSNR